MTVQEMNVVFGNNIRRCRKAKGWTLREFAEKVGVCMSLVWNWEKGLNLASAKNLLTLARLFDVEVWQLFYTDTVVKIEG